MHAFCEPSAQSASVFSVSFFALICIRLLFAMLMAAPAGLVNVSPSSDMLHLYSPVSVSEPLLLVPES